MCVLLWLKRVAIKKENVMAKKSVSSCCVLRSAAHTVDKRRGGSGGAVRKRCDGRDGVVAVWGMGIYPYSLYFVYGDMGEGERCVWCERFEVMEVDGKVSDAEPEVLGRVLERVGMMTMGVRDRRDGGLGVCVFVSDAMAYSFGGYSHEANHVADFVCEQTGVRFGSYRDGEAHAYIAGWAARMMIDYALERFVSQNKEESV